MKRLIQILFVFIFLTTCKKTDNSNTNPTSAPKFDDQLSESQLKVLDAAPLDTITKFTDLLFPDGRNISDWGKNNDSGFVSTFNRVGSILSASDKRDLFIKRMSDAGVKLTDDPLCSCFPTQPNGLAYVYGSKHTTFTFIHPDAICRQSLYGLDCSGMIYQMAVASKLNLVEGGTVDYIKPSVWNAAFNNSSDFQGLEMKDLSFLTPSQFQAGDIIVASDAHIGMVYSSSNTLGILNSQGSYNYTCLENSKSGRGPVKRSDIQKWIAQLFPNNDYHVLRVNLNGSPGLITNNVNSISQTSAISGGNITNDGGSPVIARGICWNTSTNPTVANSKTVDGVGVGSFASSLTGLTPNTKYYLRGYATNSAGTGYGNEISFITTSVPIPTWISYCYSFNHIGKSLAIDANGNKWMGTDVGLAKFDGVNWTVYNTSNSGLPNNFVLSIAIDGSGNKWIGTNGGGLAKFDGVNWTVYNTSNSGLPDGYVTSIAIEKNGNKWIGSGGSLAKFDGTTWTVYNTSNSGLPPNGIFCITIDVAGNKWIGTWSGLAKFDGNTWTVYNTSNSGLPQDYAFSIAIDKNGNKWIATILGVAKFDGNSWTVYNTSNSGLPINYDLSIAIDGSDNKWIGTNGGGLAKFDGNSWTIYNSSNSPLTDHTDVEAIIIDTNGNKWLGTSCGLMEFTN